MHCPRCDVLKKKILDLEEVISTLRQIKKDEELMDSLFAASQLEPPVCSTPIDRGAWHKVPARGRGKHRGRGRLPREALGLRNKFQPLCVLSPLASATATPLVSAGDESHSEDPPAQPVNETSPKTTAQPAVTPAEKNLPRGGLTSITAIPQVQPPCSPLLPSTPRIIARERPRRHTNDPHQDPPEAVILGSSMIRHLALKNTENFCYPGACVSDIAAVMPGILRKLPASDTVVVHCGSNDIGREQSEQLEVDFKNLINVLLETGKQTVISGPLPSPSFGDIAFSRIRQLHTFLKGYCNMLSIPFVDNFMLFWKRKYLFARDGRHLNHEGARLLSCNIEMTLDSLQAFGH